MDNYDEPDSTDSYGYVLPLSGPGKGSDPQASDGGEKQGHSRQEPQQQQQQQEQQQQTGSESLDNWIAVNNRRSSNQTDSTPRLQNTSSRLNDPNYRRGEEQTGGRNELPPTYRLPGHPMYQSNQQPQSLQYQQQYRHNQQQQSQAEQYNTNGNHPVPDERLGDSVSLTSYGTPVHGGASNKSPSSSARRRADPYRKSSREVVRSPMQTSFDGSVYEVPIRSPPGTPSSKTNTASISSNGIPIDPPGRTRPTRLSTETHSTNYSSASQSAVSHGDDDAASTVDDGDSVEPVILFNLTCPMWFSKLVKQPPSMARVAELVVKAAPCFWCRSFQGASTDRTVLTRLNVLSLFFSLIQLLASAWLATLLLIVDDEKGVTSGFPAHFWNLNGSVFSVGWLALIIMMTCFCTIRVIKEVDLVGAIRYFWVLLWLLPFQLFFIIGLFDYHSVTGVWIKHWWLRAELSWFRSYFCPVGTANSLCKVPIGGGADFSSEMDWCIYNYNATNCGEIRNNAQTDMEVTLLTYYGALGGWGCILLFLMLLMMNSLERIISKPIVQKSRETNVPAWLTLPTLGNGLVGSVLLYSQASLLSTDSGADYEWIGVIYLIAAAFFFIALLTGWFLSTFSIRNSADKSKKNIAVVIFIGVMAANVLLLASIFAASIMFSVNLVDTTPIPGSKRGDVACFIDEKAGTCTSCGALIPDEQCPEWTTSDMMKILKTQLKQSATMSAIFFLYAVNILRFGFVLRKHLSLYQIDYV